MSKYILCLMQRLVKMHVPTHMLNVSKTIESIGNEKCNRHDNKQTFEKTQN